MRLGLVFGCLVDGRCMTLVELRVDCTADSFWSVLTFWLVSFVLRVGWRLHCSSRFDFFGGCLGLSE